MTLPRTVSDVVAKHTVFEIECIDRMYLNVYVPQLQHAGGIVAYVRRQLGLPIASTVPLGKINDAFSAAMRRFAVTEGVPWVIFLVVRFGASVLGAKKTSHRSPRLVSDYAVLFETREASEPREP